MKKVSVFLVALMMVMAVVSAQAMPGNISEIADLPELPAVPDVHVRTAYGITTVTLDQPVAWFAANRNWDLTELKFDENNVASYSTQNQKYSAGFAGWGWTSGETYVSESWREDEDFEGTYEENYWRYKDGSYGCHGGSGLLVVGKGEGYTEVVFKDHFVRGGAYDTDAYICITNDNLDVRYDSHGRVRTITMVLTGKNYLGSETAPVTTTVTWTYGTNMYGKQRIYISKIVEEIDENTTVSAVFASNGKRIH